MLVLLKRLVIAVAAAVENGYTFLAAASTGKKELKNEPIRDRYPKGKP